MFIELIVIALIIGTLLKGNIKNFQNEQLVHIELIFIGVILETVLVLLRRGGFSLNSGIAYFCDLLMYLMLFAFVYLNRRLYQVLIMGMGFLFNAIAIFTNGGVMPVSSQAVADARLGIAASEIASQGLYKLADSNTNFYLLCDIIPRPYPRGFVISVGDILIAVGLFLLILKLMGSKNILKRER